MKEVRLNPDLRKEGDPELGRFIPYESQICRNIEIRESSIAEDIGKGVFTRENIKRGSVIIIGGGQLIRDLSCCPQDRDYIGVYNDKYFAAPIDFDNPSPNWLLNHSCESNVKLVGGLVIVSKRDIKEGEELTIDYSPVGAGNFVWSMNCKCGSSNCRGKISNDDWKQRDLFYNCYDEWSPYIQQKGLELFEGIDE